MADDDIQVVSTDEDVLRDQAIHSLKKKDAFKKTAAVYLLVNLFLVGIWAVSDSESFWPIWVIGGWGIALAFQAWDAYGRGGTIREEQVQEEMKRLRGG